MNNGWIKLHRKFKDWEWYKDSNTKFLFLHFLLKANHKEKKWQGIKIKSGQLITGLDKLKKETSISTQSLRTSINRLKSTSEITSKSTNKYRIITIVKWEEYQMTKDKQTSKLTSKLTNKQQSTNNQLTANNNIKNIKNEKNISKEIQAKPEYGNPLINKLINKLKELNDIISLDGTIKENRKYCFLLIKNKIKPEFQKRNKNPSDNEIVFSLEAIFNKADAFHLKNLTNFKYFYYNFNKIIQSRKKNKNIII